MSKSVIWSPKSREEWVECIDEMTDLCSHAKHRSAAIRGLKDDDAPLSREYIEDRIDIDDPLNGFQIRHSTGGWMQGFVMTTTFTTWTHYFRWDSVHPSAGLRISHKNQILADKLSRMRDMSGQLSMELEKQPRHGDGVVGVVWDTIAEISLVGALGCGEYLLRMALDDLSRKGCYEYVVLQATKSSCSFYQRFGFLRVGAVARYNSDPNSKVVGYRHWTYAEEQINRKKHGGPSLMMVKKISKNAFSIVNSLSSFIVENKPTIIPLTKEIFSNKGAIATVAEPEKIEEVVFSVSSPKLSRKVVQVVKRISSEESRKRAITNKTAVCREFLNINMIELQESSKFSSENAIVGNLRKQVSNHRDDPANPSFYNKVVRLVLRSQLKHRKAQKEKYYYVVHYDLGSQTLFLASMEIDGFFLKGERAGRSRWKVHSNSIRNIFSAPSNEYEVIRADHVAKRCYVVQERWDLYLS
eukprot:CAMPEP_0194272500 /NCGR_PEP_ID=MMETSP0169-20130528/6060_1 /TAXON_ID=218684 /ORGANISM="Corethron pennatum, Strain L29A3" /LENGTH=469 /DNA_ID=CAMNT_0039015189 /DNA_START=448 /DNA_END=1857 /DNA_ORIENTATION=+